MSKHTPGPWGWFGNAKYGMYLATVHSGHRYVMDFVRLGMRGAQPRFQVNHRMVKGQELAQFEVAPKVVGVTAAHVEGSGVYRHDIIGFHHPDAKLIAAAPELLRLLGVMFDAYENGVPCYEDPEEFAGPLGNAIKLDDADFHKIADLLNELDPRT